MNIEKANDNLLMLKYFLQEKEKNKELEDILKQTQNSWYEDTKVIEKQSKEIEELHKEINQRIKLKLENEIGIKILQSLLEKE